MFGALPACLPQLGGYGMVVAEIKTGSEIGVGRFTGTGRCVCQLYHSVILINNLLL